MEINWKIVFHQLKEPFKISHGTYLQRKALILSIEKEGCVGYGECTEIDYYGINLEEFVIVLEQLQPVFKSIALKHPFEFFEFLSNLKLHPFLQAAFDCAYWDVYGKINNKSFAQLNNFSIDFIPQSSLTMSIDTIEVVAEQIRNSKWNYIKVKVNSWDNELRDMLLSTGKKISVDSNGSFSLEQCKAIENDSRSSNFLYFEQPMPKGQTYFSQLNREGFANWTADEDIQKMEDLEKLKSHYTTVNIKVMKCGGLTPSLAIISKAKEMGFKIMIGCMTESTVGISAGIALAHLADFLDLDGANLIANDIARGSQISDGIVQQSPSPGLGIELISVT
jgi:L-alanine-DL-glutamate epimerase-like enolase superfamily enzyme